jgi:alpha-galactosidase
LIQFGTFNRILSPFEGNEAAWIFINDDKSKAVVGYFKVLSEPGTSIRILKLKVLNPELNY